jgi:hypothetical protein
MPPEGAEVRLLAGWIWVPATPRVFWVDTGCPHFGQLGNWPMQCWQSGAPHECWTEAMPPHPTHRATVGALVPDPVGVAITVDGV